MDMLHTMENLGGAETFGSEVRSEIDFVKRIEAGLPVETAEALKRLGDLSEADLNEIVPRRTLSHARKRNRLSPEHSDRVVRAAAVYTHAQVVFANPGKANRWMRCPNRALEGQTPLSLLRTSNGTGLVEQTLDRIAYGVFS